MKLSAFSAHWGYFSSPSQVMFLLCIGIPLSIWDHEALWNTVSRHWHCHLVAWSVRKEAGAAKRGERQGSSSLYSSSPTHRDHSAEGNEKFRRLQNCSELFRTVQNGKDRGGWSRTAYGSDFSILFQFGSILRHRDPSMQWMHTDWGAFPFTTLKAFINELWPDDPLLCKHVSHRIDSSFETIYSLVAASRSRISLFKTLLCVSLFFYFCIFWVCLWKALLEAEMVDSKTIAVILCRSCPFLFIHCTSLYHIVPIPALQVCVMPVLQ